MTKLEKEVKKVLDGYAADKEQRTQELRESLERRTAWIEGEGDKSGFDPEDELWAESLGVNPKKLDDAERTKLVKETKKAVESEISDTEAYLDDAIERMEEVWRIFTEMKVKDVINDEAVFRELKDRFGSPFGWGEYFRGGMGAEAIRDLLEQVDL
jgi:DNA-directed RNA polymerase subunit beta'